MSIRANSLRIVVVDTLFFMGVMSLAAATCTAVANGAEPRIVRVAEAETTDRPSSDHVDSRLNTDDNLPSGIPEESPTAKREAMMLGMKLFERSEGVIEVVDVAATSPAWDAGIRPGDRIREMDGVKPKSLATWVEDMGKVLKNTEDGNSIAAEFVRDGDPLSVRIKVPVSKAAEVRDARQEELAIARMRAQQQRQGQMPQGQPGGVPASYDARERDYGPGYPNGGYGGWGFGGFFDDGGTTSNNGDRMASSGFAPLMAVDPLVVNGGQSSGGQVGVAGFRDDANGVNAMVVVRGLPQGTYQVGIGEGGQFGSDANPDFVGPDVGADGQFGLNPALQGTADSFDRGGANASRAGSKQPGAANNVPNGVNPNGNHGNPRNPGRNQLPTQQQPGVVPQGNVAPGAGAVPGAAGGGGGGSNAPAGGNGASLANPRNAYLAQQLDIGQANPPAGRQTANPTQAAPQRAQQSPSSAPTTNAAVPGANPYDPRDRAEAQRQAKANHNPLNNGAETPGFASLGTLQVGPDGSGQVQNHLEGMTVRNLAGMQVFVQSTNFQEGTTAPNGAAVQGGAAGANNRTGARNQAVLNRSAQQQGQSAQPGPSPGFAFPGEIPARGAEGIVAIGTIQLRNGGNGTGTNPTSDEQPLDEATRREQGRSQISDPTQQFKPSNSLK